MSFGRCYRLPPNSRGLALRLLVDVNLPEEIRPLLTAAGFGIGTAALEGIE
jgi:hypothetical protein